MAGTTRRISRARWARVVTAASVIVLFVVADVFESDVGTLCSGGVNGASFLCPLGFLQMVLAARRPLFHLWPSAGLALLAVVVLGRFFCAWICPGALLQNLFGRSRATNLRRETVVKTNPVTLRGEFPSTPNQDRASTLPGHKIGAGPSYAAYAFLAGGLLSSLLFRFPVFCLICPVGLFMGSLFAASRFFLKQQPSLELLFFPALLVLEFVLLRRWCSAICPLGALLTLGSKLNLFLRPTLRSDDCLSLRGAACQVCLHVCPEEIYLPAGEGGTIPSHCTKCLECYEHCPVHAVQVRWIPLRRRIAGLGRGHHAGSGANPSASTAHATPVERAGSGNKRKMDGP